ncbi:MAG: RNA methyltransferase [Archangiaceae bacterium]|nr:RNA methyltransferase [Archangiaceae bacterium]
MNQLERLVVVLVRSEGPLNVGSVARLCGNFGCALRLVQPLADRQSTDAIKMAHPSEALLAMAPVFSTLGEALSGVSLAIATSSKIAKAAEAPWLSVARARLLLPPSTEQVALVFGNERTGLSAEEASQCPRIVRLPTPGPTESLNLSHAVAVTLALFAAAAEGGDSLDDASFRASAEARRALIRAVTAALEARGFFHRDTGLRETFAPRLKELSDKMDVSERDLGLLQDLLRVLSGDPGAPLDLP